ncbi:MAG: hypothetical protein J5533_08410 [Bacteroidales bacterium]|nr:hypothetical protein [Bacteroidales bacterium]
MKKIFYILSLLAAASIALVSCEPEITPHEPGEPETNGCYGVYFPTQAASGDHVYSPVQDKVLDVTVARTNTSGAITVPVKMTFSEDGIFEVAPVTFADGQEEATFSVRFDKAKEGVNYAGSFVIEDNQYASKYNSNPIALDFSVLCVEMKQFLNPKTNEPAVFTFTHNWSGSRGEGHATMQYYEVDGIRTCIFTSVDKDDSGNPVGLWHGDASGTLTLRWYTGDQPSVKSPGTMCSHKNNEGNDFVEIVTQYIGFDYNDGNWIATPSPKDPINAYDYFWYWNMRGYSIEELNGSWLDDANIEGSPDEGYPLGYYDGNGGFFLYIYYYIPGLGGWKPSGYNNVLIADGFTRVDYSLELETDYSAGGKTPVFVEAGMDVTSVKYAVYQGELTETQVGNKTDAIIAGTEPATEFSEFAVDEEEAVKYATLELAPEATGYYTVVVVAYDKDKAAQNSGSIVIKHIAAGDVEKYAVDLALFTEPVPARYGEEFNEYNSFAFAIVGKGITEAHVAVLPLSKVSGSFLDELKADEDGDYAVDESTLKAINETGGFYDVVGGLKDGTSYALVVWATNGDSDTFDASVWMTTKSPEVWKPYGTATWTDAFFGPWFGAPAVTYDVALEQSVDDPTRFRLVNVYGKGFPYNEPGDWDDTQDYYLVINTAEPAYTWFETFDTGCNWGYGNFILTTQVGRYVDNGYTVEAIKAAGVPAAKYADNKITFEYRAILKAMTDYNNGGWYYGNNDEANPYVITFNPGAQLQAASVVAPAHASNVTSAVKFSGAKISKTRIERDPKPVEVSSSVSFSRKVKEVGPVKYEKRVDVR